MARTALDLYTGNRLLNLLTNDRGRFIISLLIVAFARDEQGLTARRLAAACVETGLCSAGRARALLRLMQWSGHVETSPAGLRPGEKLITLHRERLRRVLPAHALVLPDIADAVGAIETPGLVEAFCAAQARAFLAGHRIGEGVPAVVPIVERSAGLLVLLALHLVARGAEPGPLTVAGLARRFHVSRPHVDTLVRLARDRGLALRDADGVRPGPALREAIEGVLSAVMAWNAKFIVEAMGAVAPAAPVPPPRQPDGVTERQH